MLPTEILHPERQSPKGYSQIQDENSKHEIDMPVAMTDGQKLTKETGITLHQGRSIDKKILPGLLKQIHFKSPHAAGARKMMSLSAPHENSDRRKDVPDPRMCRNKTAMILHQGARAKTKQGDANNLKTMPNRMRSKKPLLHVLS